MNMNLIKCEFENCNKAYGSTFNLKRHVEIAHLGLRKFKCDVCGRTLSSKQNLLDHKNLHTGAKPYICEHPGCECAFRQLCQLYIHRQVHKEIAIYSNKKIISRDLLLLLIKRLTEDSRKKDWKAEELGVPIEPLPAIRDFKEKSKLPLLEILANMVKN